LGIAGTMAVTDHNQGKSGGGVFIYATDDLAVGEDVIVLVLPSPEGREADARFRISWYISPLSAACGDFHAWHPIQLREYARVLRRWNDFELGRLRDAPAALDYVELAQEIETAADYIEMMTVPQIMIT
jgi:hypothetical protein